MELCFQCGVNPATEKECFTRKGGHLNGNTFWKGICVSCAAKNSGIFKEMIAGFPSSKNREGVEKNEQP